MAGKDSGERLWPFPMDADFDAALKSSVADVLQCTVSSEADHILAAVFLKKFVNKDVKWVHLDLCPAAKPGTRRVSFTDDV
jgi:leucyl aminopeptidase